VERLQELEKLGAARINANEADGDECVGDFDEQVFGLDLEVVLLLFR